MISYLQYGIFKKSLKDPSWDIPIGFRSFQRSVIQQFHLSFDIIWNPQKEFLYSFVILKTFFFKLF